MAKGRVATAYVEIKPDLRGFAKDLREQLAARKAGSIKVPVEADSKGMAESIRKSVDNPEVKAATKAAADDMAKLQAEALKDNATFDRERKAQNALMLRDAYRENDEWNKVRQAKVDAEKAAVAEVNRAHAEALREQKTMNDTMLRDAYRANAEFDRVRRARKDAEERDWAIMLRNAYRDNAEWEKIRKDKIATEKALAAEVNRVHAQALKENEDYDRKHRSWIIKNFESLEQSLRQVSNGWLGLFMNPIGAAVAAAILATVVGFVGALINTLSLAAAGAVPIALGVFLNKSKPAFQSASSKLMESVKTVFKDMAEPMVTPLIYAMDTLREGLGPIKKIGMEIFGGLTAQIHQLSRGVVGFMTNIMAGVRDAMPAIRAVLSALAESLPRLGETIGKAFRILAWEPEEAAHAIDGLVTALQNFIKASAYVIRAAMLIGDAVRELWGAWYGLMNAVRGTMAVWKPEDIVPRWKSFWNQITGRTLKASLEHKAHMQKIAEDTANMIDEVQKLGIKGLTSKMIEDEFKRLVTLGGEDVVHDFGFKETLIKNLRAIAKEVNDTNWQKYAQDAATGFRTMDKASIEARKSIDDLIDKLDILNGRFIDLEDATENFYEIQDNVTEEMNKGLTPAFTDFTKLGREHQQTIRDQAKAIEDVVKAQLKQGMSLAEILPKFNEMRDLTLKNATAFSGSREEAAKYLAQLRLTPEEVITQLALAGMPEAQAELEKITGQKSVTIGATADGNQFALVGQYIVEQMTNIGGHAGESFHDFMLRKTTESFYDQSTNWRLVGQNVGQSVQDGLKEPNWRAVGQQVNSQVSQGVTTSGPPQAAGTAIASGISQGISGYSMASAGMSLINSLATALQSNPASSVITNAASTVAGWFRGAFQGHSPPDYGPLSGRGYMTYVGQTLVSDLAKGMLMGESKVEKASAQVAAAIAFGGNYGLTTTVGPAMLGVNVYVGNEKLDSRIDYRVDRKDETNALGLYAGRTEV